MQNGNGQAKIRFSLFTKKSQAVIEKMLGVLPLSYPGEESPFKDIPQGKQSPSDEQVAGIIKRLLRPFSSTTTPIAHTYEDYENINPDDDEPMRLKDLKEYVHDYLAALDQILGCEEMDRVTIFQNVTLTPKIYENLFSKILECVSTREHLSDANRAIAWDSLDTLRWIGNNNGLRLSDEKEILISGWAGTRTSPNKTRSLQNMELISFIPKVSATSLKAPGQQPQLV